VESLVILVVAAGLSAAVVWWAMSPPEGRARPRRERPAARRADVPRDEADGFVLLRGAARTVDEERPPAAWSLLRIALVIAVAIVVVVAVVGLIGLLVKVQLDQYFAMA
jgi:hypothetical protein